MRLFIYIPMACLICISAKLKAQARPSTTDSLDANEYLSPKLYLDKLPHIFSVDSTQQIGQKNALFSMNIKPVQPKRMEKMPQMSIRQDIDYTLQIKKYDSPKNLNSDSLHFQLPRRLKPTPGK